MERIDWLIDADRSRNKQIIFQFLQFLSFSLM
jgi:hypothetical protein